MKITKKFKFACASLLAVCCIGTAAAGVMLSDGSTSAKADEPKAKWYSTAPLTSVGDEIVYVNGNTFLFNRSVDILSLPNQTAVFYMYYSASVAWSGFTFTNGTTATTCSWTLDGCDTTLFPWHALCFEGNNSHMILQDNRVFSGAGTHGGVNGVDGEKFMDGMIPVEVHIGEGSAAGDRSYVKIGGVELIHETTSQPVTTAELRADSGQSKELTASMFPDGAYLAVNYNGSGEPMLAVSEPGSVTALNANLDLKKTVQAGEIGEDLKLDLSAAEAVFGEGCNVTVKANGKTQTVQPELQAEADGKSAKLTLSKEELNKIPVDDLEALTYLVFSFEKDGTDYGSAVVAFRVLFEEPPVLEESDLALDAADTFSVSFTYSGTADPVTGTTIKYQASASDTAKELAEGDFTVTKGQDGKYTITFTKACAEKLFGSHSSTILTIKFGKHELRVTAFVASHSPYGVRYREGIDYVDGTLKQDEFYSSAQMKTMSTATLSSRIFYENSIDVTKPIFIEYGTLDPSVEWGLISIMNTPAISEYFSNETSPQNGNTVCFILFGQGRHNLQGMNGTFKDGNTLEHAPNTNMKNNYVEISLGAENPEDGYIKINGEKVSGATLTKSQKDFPDGKAWVGWFFNNKEGPFDFTVNTHINPVVVSGPQDDSAYRMDLGAAKDFSVDLTNTSGKLTLKDESGKEIPAAQYSYAGGKLTIKAEYFSAKAFVQEGRIYIWDTEKEVGTSFRMAYSNSAMGNAYIAYAAKGANQDVSFDLGITAVSGILQKGEPVPAEHYTVEGGKLIIKAAALKDEVGAQEFFVTADGKMFPCYVYVDNFENGVALGSGAVRTEKGFTLTDVTSATEAVTYDLSKGFKLGFSFTSIASYYERRANSDGTRFTLKFLDPMSGNTFVISVYANFEDDKITSANNALYLSYAIVDGEGKTVWSENPRGMTPTDGNNSASGEHNFEISEKNGGLTITVAGRPCSISAKNLTEFGFKACVLTLTTEGVAAGSETELVLGGYGASTPDTPDNPDTPDTPDKPDNPENPDVPDGGDEADNGCGSVIGGYGWMIALAAIVLSAGLILFLRRRENR